MITDTDAIAPTQPFLAALRLQVAPGWHTYWRNAGDAGAAPELGLTLPAGTTAGPINWPTPERTTEGQLTTYAYTGDVVLPFHVVPGSAPLALTAHATWLVCRDICIPEEGDFAVDLPGGSPSRSAEAPLFDAVASHTPVPAPFQARVAPDGTLSLTGDHLPADIASAEFLPAGDGIVETVGPQPVHRAAGAMSIKLAFASPVDVRSTLAGVLKLTDQQGNTTAYDVSAIPGGQTQAKEYMSASSLALLLLGALGGGFLLNLMPCVFPVLAMKAMALARLSGADHTRVRAEGASYTLGVVVAFLTLGGILLALRRAGEAAGWGFQLQSPVFVTLLAWLLFLTALNMSNVYAVGARFAGTGGSLAARGGHAGSFFTGLLAVVVATPCTASFMGAAVAGALAAPASVAMAVFAAMGLGLALPYTLVAAFPRLAAILPRPGRWMDTLRQALAFPLYASVAWLVWVVSQQSGSAGVLTAACGLVGLGFAGWARGAAQASVGRPRAIWNGGAAFAGIASLGLLFLDAAPAQNSEPYSPSRLAELRTEGRPVFVNMTAAWCLSCLVNERLALSPQAVQDAFARAHVAYLKGDWTNQNPVISAFLQDHGREGVPLYIFYPPGREPIVLPQILSESALITAVGKVGS